MTDPKNVQDRYGSTAEGKKIALRAAENRARELAAKNKGKK